MTEPTSAHITDQIYMGAEAAMSNALAGVSRPNGVRDFSSYFVLHYCSLFCFTHDTTYFNDGRVNEVPPTTIGGAPWSLLWEC